MNRPRGSFAGRIAALAILLVAGFGLVFYGLRWWSDSETLAIALAGILALVASAWGSRAIVRHWRNSIQAVTHGIGSLRDGDLSVSITSGLNDEIDPLVLAYNGLGDALRRQRLDLHHRELLLDTVIQATPMALVLTNARNQVVLSNFAARSMLNNNRPLEGATLPAILASVPQTLQDALASQGDGLFTIEIAGESAVFHITQRRFNMHSQPHRLILLRPLTRELAAQEVAVWKKVVRVIAHELNNSLAPISSLAHSGRALAGEHANADLQRVFSVIDERAAHLARFIDGYARFAKLPLPRPARVAWSKLLEPLIALGPIQFEIAANAKDAWLDESQINQVLVNLVRNALESGSAPESISLRIAQDGREHRIRVEDAGQGFTDEALRSALLPFFSTKSAGTGLGLTLCREIIEAHGGRMAIANRPAGGASVTLWLPSSMT